MKLKGIIFDFNGVILWDSAWHEQSWGEVARELRGFPMTPEELANTHGRPLRDNIAYMLGRPIENSEIPGFVEMKEGRYRELALSKGAEFCLSRGAEILFDKLIRENIPHTIATASEITNVRFFYEHLGLEQWFPLQSIVYDDGKFPGKPAPDIYLLAAKKLGFAPTECTVIEDARSGIASAYAAGIGKIIALGPKEKHAELAALPGVNQVIENLGEIDLSEF